MTYELLIKMNRRQLLTTQATAIANQDTVTLKKIAKVLTGFEPQAMVPKGLTWMNEEVEDIVSDRKPLDERTWFTSYR